MTMKEMIEDYNINTVHGYKSFPQGKSPGASDLRSVGCDSLTGYYKISDCLRQVGVGWLAMVPDRLV